MTTTTSTQPDQFGNVRATEGCDRCPCGAKYWENDICVSCGEPFVPPTHAEDPTGLEALIVASVPQSANFEFRYGGFSFFTLRNGEYVAVAR